MTPLLPLVRIVLALLLTLIALPYAHGRVLVFGMLTGSPEPEFLGMMAAAVIAVIGLTWKVHPQIADKPWAKWVLPLVFFGWLAENAILVWMRSGTLIPKIYVLALFLPATLWLIWLAWMCFRPWRWTLRLGLLLILLLDLNLFFKIIRVDGLTGDGDVNFAWVDNQPRRTIEDTKVEEAIRLVADPARDYAQFLGPQRLGVLPHAKLSTAWDTQRPRELWRKSVGEGWGSFAVVGDLIYTQEQRGEEECVVCYRLHDGALVWLHRDPVNYSSSLGGPGPRATPTVTQGRVFAVGATGVLNCLDAETGKKNWSVNILKDNQAEEIAHGVCASPLVLEEQVIVCPTGKNGLSLAAYHRETGSRLWQGGRHQASYGSPLLTELGGVRQILLYNAEGVAGHDPANGKVLWFFPWTNGEKVNCSQPLPHAGAPDHVFISTGYGKGCALIRVQHNANAWSVATVWSNNKLKNKFTTSVLHEGHLYGLDDGILACQDVQTGERKWKEGRYGHGQLLLAGKFLLIQAEDGKVVLVDPQPDKLRELGRLPALKGKTWNNPALAGRYLLVRNDMEAVCYELPLAK